MKSLLLLAVIIGTAAAVELRRGKPERDEDWKKFKASFGKNYKDGVEETRRRGNWERNRDTIEKHNAEAAKGLHTFTLGDNHLTDRDVKEVEELLGARRPSKDEAAERLHDVAETRQVLPSTVDWRTSSCLPPVKNQGKCGSCWAFGATTPVEFASCNKTASKTPVLLSESQLVNCSSSFGNKGCNGGWMTNAWRYVQAAPGQAASSVLPYYPANATCQYNNATMKAAANVVSYRRVANTTSSMMQALATQGPLSVAMVVSGTFSQYKSGVFSNSTCPTDCSNVNHIVVLVGYSVSNTSVPYWIVRNSWGTNWGAAGYIMIERGRNMCNIECYAYYVTV